MNIDASSVAASTTRNDLIRAAAQASRTQRTFDAGVLGNGRRSEALSFRGIMDHVSLSVRKPSAHLATSLEAATYTKPQPAPGATLPPVTPGRPPVEIVDGVKADPNVTQATVEGEVAGARPAPTAEAETALPHSVLQAQLLEAFGATADEPGFNAALDLDGDGTIGLNDLNTLNFNASASPDPLPPAASASVPSVDEVIQTKIDLVASESATGKIAHADPAPEPPATTELPASAVQARLMESFGAIEGDDAYDASLDFDGDGIIGLNDLNHLLFNSN